MILDLRHLALGVAAGVGVGIGAGALLAQQQLRLDDPSSSLAASAHNHPAAKYGLPQHQTLRAHQGFLTMFDSATRNPAWVLEHVREDQMYGDGDRGNSFFYEDEGLDERLRNKLGDFRGSGYDRGHMAPAANHKGHQKKMDETFVLSNVSPQVGAGFNRDAWARLEKFVKDLASNSDDLYVVTGPLYLPTLSDGEGERGENGKGGGAPTWRAGWPMIGTPPSLVAVPTHFYKVVLADNPSGKHGPHRAAVGAFVMPNARIDPKTPLTAFVVPLDNLETAAGTRFFPAFVDAGRRAALDKTALAHQDRGRAGMRLLERQALATDQAVILPERAVAALLDAPASSGSSSSNDTGKRADDEGDARIQQQQQPQQQQQQAPLPGTTGGRGAVHICEVVACKLPPEKWWLDGKKGAGKGRGSGGGSNATGSARAGRAGSAPPQLR